MKYWPYFASRSRITHFLILFFSAYFFIAEIFPMEDRVVLYQMKEDPTLAEFVGVKEIVGFYTLELDEYYGKATILYRQGENVYSSAADLKIKGDQLLLKNKKHKKVYQRTNNLIYAPACPPDAGGWRRGASFGQHSVRKNDDLGRRLIVVQANLEFETSLHRCAGPEGDCGPSGCAEWGPISSSTKSISTPIPKSTVSLSTALINGTLTEEDLRTTYKSKIDSVLPPTVGIFVATSTGVRSANLPYPYIANPTFEQQNKTMGVVFKTYISTENAAPIQVDVQPLLAEYQPASPTKCGAWDPSPFRSIFTLRGLPALFIETPATGNTPAGATLVACGQTVSILIQTKFSRTKEFLISFYESLPVGQIEYILGGK